MGRPAWVMNGQPVTQPPREPDDTGHDLAHELREASDAELTAILNAADQADIAMHRPGALATPVTRARPGTAEIVLLGALGPSGTGKTVACASWATAQP
jgi:hypothetical protein